MNQGFRRRGKRGRQTCWPWLALATACTTYGPTLLTGNDDHEGNGGSPTAGTSSQGGAAGAQTSGGRGGSTMTSGGGAPQGGAPDGGAPEGGAPEGGSPATGGAAGPGGEAGTGGAGPGGEAGTGGAGPGGEAGTTGGEPSAGSGGEAGAGGCPGGDCCPNDDAKTDPGVCGCDVSDADGDDDGTPDCNDDCPDDPDKTDPETCGCGIPDEDTTNAAGCLGLLDALVHRYPFDDSGSTAVDTVGSADMTVYTATLNGSGALELAGTTSGHYAALPGQVLSSLSAATIETWVTWDGGSAWQRIFDFGSQTGSGGSAAGVSYVFLTPRSTGTSPYLRAAYSLNGSANETIALGDAALPTATLFHLAVVLDVDAGEFSLVLDGARVDTVPLTIEPSEIDDSHDWIGRSQFGADYGFDGKIFEFRIYDAALTDAQLALSFDAGPDADFLP